MGLQDRHIDSIRKRVWIDPLGGLGLIGNGTSGLVGAQVAGVTTAAMGAGFMSLIMVAAEDIDATIRCPIDLDPKFEVGFRICWTMDYNTGTGSADWILLQSTIAEGEPFALPATALNTTIPDDAYVDENGIASTADWDLQWTARGIRNSIGLTRAQIEAGAFITMNMELDAATAGTTYRYIGLEMDYAVHACQGPGQEIDNVLAT